MKKKLTDILFDTTKGKIKLNQRASIFFFCLLLSTFFWFLSILSKSYTTILRVPIQYEGIADNFILTEAPNKQIEIEVFGSGFELLGEQLSLDKAEVKVDLNLARKINKDNYGFSAEKLRNKILENLGKDLNLRTILTDSIRFKTQKKISKQIDIVAILDIDYRSGFNLRGEVKVIPNKIMISGPEEAINDIHLIQTESVKLSDVSDSILKEVELNLSEFGDGIVSFQDKVSVSIPVEKYTEKQLILPLYIKMGMPDVELRTYPDEVKAVLIVPLSKYEIVNTDLLSATVNFDKESLTKKKLSVKLSGVPEYAKLLRIEPDRVEFIVKK